MPYRLQHVSKNSGTIPPPGGNYSLDAHRSWTLPVADTRLTGLLRRLHAGPAPASADREALAAFVARRDEAACAALVQRHGPIRHAQDAEDAFQATFLVLARNWPRTTK